MTRYSLSRQPPKRIAPAIETTQTQLQKTQRARVSPPKESPLRLKRSVAYPHSSHSLRQPPKRIAPAIETLVEDAEPRDCAVSPPKESPLRLKLYRILRHRWLLVVSPPKESPLRLKLDLLRLRALAGIGQPPKRIAPAIET